MAKRIGNVGVELAEAREAPVAGFDAGEIDGKSVTAAAKAPLEALLAHAADGRDYVRRNAWRAIIAKGALDEYATLRAAVALRDEDDEVKALAAKALEKADASAAERVIDGLVRARLDPAHAVREAAQATLAAQADLFLSRLPELFDARDDRIQAAIVDTCAEIGAKKLSGAVTAALTHIGPIHRQTALAALLRFGSKEIERVWTTLVEGLRDPYDQARAGFVLALAEVPAKAAKDAAIVARLTEMYEDDGSWIVRDAADKALRRIGGA